MKYRDFQGEKISLLGFGLMRLPKTEDGAIDEDAFIRMADYAVENGVNYFDTAWPYHGGNSELAAGRMLKRYDRKKINLADKYPGHQIAEKYDPAATFERQLEKCDVDYFDFYLLHNVYENSIGVYEDERWKIIEYFIEQKKAGRIRHLGFSSHARPDTLETFLERHGEDMEFCQIELNYLDWTLQDAKKKCEILNARGVPIIVMEPIRGGRLAKPGKAAEAALRAIRPDESPAAWALRWLEEIPGIFTVLSGMSNEEQMRENVKTYSGGQRLTGGEIELLADVAEALKDAVPCTGCRYCVEGCPMGLDIPMLISAYNDVKFAGGTTVPMQMDALPEDKLPSACISCGACTGICPQKIDVPKAMESFAEALAKLPKWADICKQREEEAKKLENK